MAYNGVPIANGDGSYSFDAGMDEPLVLRGDAAARAFANGAGRPDAPAAPPPGISPDLLMAGQGGPDERLAANNAHAAPPRSVTDFGGGAPGLDVISGFNLQDQANKNAKQAYLAQPAAAHAHAGGAAAPAGDGPSSAELTGMLNKPLPAAAPEQEHGKAKGGAVFFQPGAGQGGGGVGGGPVFHKGGYTPVQQTIQGTTPMSDEDVLAKKRADQGVYLAAEQTTDAEVAKAQDAAKVRAAYTQTMQEETAKHQASEAERQQVIGAKMAKIDQMAQDAAAEKIHGYWEDKSAETKFASAIFSGLGAFAEARGGGPNYAVQQLNRAIDMEYKTQEANLENKHRAIAEQTNVLGQLRQEFGDRESAASAFRAMRLATAGAQLEEINARNLPAEQKAKLAEFAASLNQQYQQQMQQTHQTQYSRTERYTPSGWVGTGVAPDKKTETGAKEYGEKVESAKLNETDASVANVDAKLQQYKGSDHIPGVESENALTRGVKHAADWLVGDGTGDKLYYNQEERQNRQTVAYMKADIRHAITGAGMSNEERSSLDSMIEGSKTYGEMANTVKVIKGRIAAHKADLAGGYTPQAVQLYEQRRQAAHQQIAGQRGPTIRRAGE
jgi:hypothetical protein